MTKPFLSFEDQINKLQNEKGLIINDHLYAEKMLREIGYFGLIGGYKTPFKNPTTKKYKDGVAFEDIVALYKFDENLRELFLKYLLQIERNMRSLVSYYFTEKYGELQSCYLDGNNYNSDEKYRYDIVKLIEVLKSLAKKTSGYAYINYQRTTYGNVPLWVLVNGLSFGTISKFYTLLTQDVKVKVSKNFDCVNEKQLSQFLKVATKFRNVCAHNERLFSYQTKNDIPNTDVHESFSIPKKGTQYIYGKHDLFSLVVMFCYLLPEQDFRKFLLSLSNIFNHYFDGKMFLSKKDIYKLMGFPENWSKIALYKNKNRIVKNIQDLISDF